MTAAGLTAPTATVSGPVPHDGGPSAAALLAAGDITGLLRVCHERRLEREGIPMILGLADERAAIPANTASAQLDEGARLSTLLAGYAAALVPFARDDDEGAVITAMQLLAYTHFRPGAQPVSENGPQAEENVL